MFSRRNLNVGVSIVGTLLGVKILYALRGFSWMTGATGYLFALLLLGVPMWMRQRGLARCDFLNVTGSAIIRSAAIGAGASVILLPLYLLGNHFYQHWVWSADFHAAMGGSLRGVAVSQFFLVALPEEFFFRGFIQEECNRLWGQRWKILGVSVGWGWILVAILFALSHSFITVRWWHLFIFFPGLVFGWLREADGGILAPTLFHAASNVTAQWIVWHYR